MSALHQDGSKLPGPDPLATIGRYPCNLYNLVMEVITVFLYLRLFLQSTKGEISKYGEILNLSDYFKKYREREVSK